MVHKEWNLDRSTSYEYLELLDHILWILRPELAVITIWDILLARVGRVRSFHQLGGAAPK